MRRLRTNTAGCASARRETGTPPDSRFRALLLTGTALCLAVDVVALPAVAMARAPTASASTSDDPATAGTSDDDPVYDPGFVVEETTNGTPYGGPPGSPADVPGGPLRNDRPIAKPEEDPREERGKPAGTTLVPCAAVGTSGTFGGQRYVVYRDEVRVGGHRNWRNNNYGNLRFSDPYGSKAKDYGAIGADREGFAIFPNDEVGKAAVDRLLKEPRFQRSTLAEAIAMYAPSTENNTDAYIESVSRQTGVDRDKVLSELSPDKLASVAEAIRLHEGRKEGKPWKRNDASAPLWVRTLLRTDCKSNELPLAPQEVRREDPRFETIELAPIDPQDPPLAVPSDTAEESALLAEHSDEPTTVPRSPGIRAVQQDLPDLTVSQVRNLGPVPPVKLGGSKFVVDAPSQALESQEWRPAPETNVSSRSVPADSNTSQTPGSRPLGKGGGSGVVKKDTHPTTIGRPPIATRGGDPGRGAPPLPADAGTRPVQRPGRAAAAGKPTVTPGRGAPPLPGTGGRPAVNRPIITQRPAPGKPAVTPGRGAPPLPGASGKPAVNRPIVTPRPAPGKPAVTLGRGAPPLPGASGKPAVNRQRPVALGQ